MSAILGNSSHFMRVARVYGRLRDTDPRVARAIIDQLPKRSGPLDVADVGCGTGRYSEMILTHLDADSRLYCCDYSPAMLAECKQRMQQVIRGRRVYCSRSSADQLPLADSSLDALVTFNAVHHFHLEQFVSEARRVLRPDGILAIYTRTRDQNARTVWGQYFPHFNDYEQRLFTLSQLQEAVLGTPGLSIHDVKELSFSRHDTPETLVEKARQHHYSTFALYPREEFKGALTVFEQSLKKLTNGAKTVEHCAHNTLIVARRIASSVPLSCDVAP